MPGTAHRYDPYTELNRDSLCWDCQLVLEIAGRLYCPEKDRYLIKGYNQCSKAKVYCDECGGFGVIDENYTPCPECGGTGYYQSSSRRVIK